VTLLSYEAARAATSRRRRSGARSSLLRWAARHTVRTAEPLMLYNISKIVTLVIGTLALVAIITLVEAQCDEQANITRSDLLHECLVRLTTDPKAPGLAGSELMIIDDTALCSLRPVTSDEPIVLMVRVRHSLFYFSMPNMVSCLDAKWRFEDLISMVSPISTGEILPVRLADQESGRMRAQSRRPHLCDTCRVARSLSGLTT